MSNFPDRPLFDSAETPDKSSMHALQELRGQLDKTHKAFSDALPLPTEVFVVINTQLVVVSNQIERSRRSSQVAKESLEDIRTQIDALNRMIKDAVREKKAKHTTSFLNS
jgi:hypothetical protein